MKKCSFSKLVLAIFVSLISQLGCAETIEIRKLTPPNLKVENLGRKIVAYRPMRSGSPAMSLEIQGDKIIVSNYGHGGSGWSLGPGSAKYVVNLLEQNEYAKELGKDQPIVVVGAGAIGMLSALELLNQGYTNIRLVAEEYDNLTSHAACGVFAAVSMDNDPKMQAQIDAIGFESYKFYKSIATKQNEQFNSGARIVPAYFSTRDDAGLEPYVGKVMRPAKDVIVDFQNGTTHKMVVYDDGIFIETENLMHLLRELLKESNVKFEQSKVFKLSEVKEKIVFNCTGNGAKELVNDNKMIPVQGHLLMLKDQNPSDVEYMLLVYLNEDKNKHNQNVMRMFYMFPKQSYGATANDIGVLGGTLIEVADKSTPNMEEFDIILQNTKRFYGLTTGPDTTALQSIKLDKKKKDLICYGF